MIDMSYDYRGAIIPGYCENRCFERLVDQAIATNRVEETEPLFRSYHNGRTSFEILRWSKKLKRYQTRPQGNYIHLDWAYCPHCGMKLTQKLEG